MATYSVPDGYDRTKNPRMISVRDLTREEALSLSGHADIIAKDGTLRTVKINGKVRTWKTDPSRIEVPCKYGMYEYATFRWTEGFFDSDTGLLTDCARIVKRIE